ncbi:MAG: ATP-binding cassette domain-containing protein [Acidobacteria bacterium]|nr:MAG: ATP-binding cassette domain-containing protein [Acidobacteriota bacterium]
MENISIRAENITKKFGDFTAVDSLSIEVRSGRVFGFLGPNGAGKTTTIRMIVGIIHPDSGRIEVLGSSSPELVQNKIGYLPEERGLYKKMKIVDQLRYFAALKGVSRSEIDKRIDYWLERMKLLEWKNKKSNDLSKGMAQKIQFISAVLHDPELLILDEPFSGLDPINVEFLIDIVSELKSQNKTIIFSTHLMETAERLCDDILLINKSRKVVSGTLRDVKSRFRKNIVALRIIGEEKVLLDKSLVARLEENSDEKRVFLAENTDSQLLLRRLINDGATVLKFELVEPSLKDIFIEKITDPGD